MRSGAYAELAVRLLSREAGYVQSKDFDGLCEERDAVDARATNAVILDLKPLLKQAIMSFYLGERWVQSFLLSPCVSEAVEAVANGLRKKGIV